MRQFFKGIKYLLRYTRGFIQEWRSNYRRLKHGNG